MLQEVKKEEKLSFAKSVDEMMIDKRYLYFSFKQPLCSPLVFVNVYTVTKSQVFVQYTDVYNL